jgi:predicted membrane protein
VINGLLSMSNVHELQQLKANLIFLSVNMPLHELTMTIRKWRSTEVATEPCSRERKTYLLQTFGCCRSAAFGTGFRPKKMFVIQLETETKKRYGASGIIFRTMCNCLKSSQD